MSLLPPQPVALRRSGRAVDCAILRTANVVFGDPKDRAKRGSSTYERNQSVRLAQETLDQVLATADADVFFGQMAATLEGHNAVIEVHG